MQCNHQAAIINTLCPICLTYLCEISLQMNYFKQMLDYSIQQILPIPVLSVLFGDKTNNFGNLGATLYVTQIMCLCEFGNYLKQYRKRGEKLGKDSDSKYIINVLTFRKYIKFILKWVKQWWEYLHPEYLLAIIFS